MNLIERICFGGQIIYLEEDCNLGKFNKNYKNHLKSIKEYKKCEIKTEEEKPKNIYFKFLSKFRKSAWQY